MSLNKTVKLSDRNHARLMHVKKLMKLNSIDEVIDKCFEFIRIMAIRHEANRAQAFRDAYLEVAKERGETIFKIKDGKIVDVINPPNKKTIPVESSIGVSGTVLRNVENTAEFNIKRGKEG